MRRIPEFRLVVQTHERGQRRIRGKDARHLLVHRPEKLIHVSVSVVRIRTGGKWRRSNRAFLVNYLFEPRQVWRITDVNRAALIRRDQALQLDRHHACHAQSVVRRDKTAYRLRWSAARTQEVVILVEEVAARVGGVRFPVVGRPSISTCTIEGEVRWRAGDARIEIEAVDPRRNGLCLRRINRYRHIRRSGRDGAHLGRVGRLSSPIQG